MESLRSAGGWLRPLLPNKLIRFSVFDLWSVAVVVVLCLCIGYGLLHLFIRAQRRWMSVDPLDSLPEFSVEPCRLEFKNISYKRNGKMVLDGISGVASPGKVMAVLGPSGAGKTTLLEILAGRSTSGEVDGELTMNLMRTWNPQMCGYFEPSGGLIDTLTIRENLMYSAMLRLPGSMPIQRKHQIVQQVIENLQIDHVDDQIISKVSSGEQRRTMIAQELVHCPGLVVLDEPLEGLDDHNAHSVIKTISEFAKHHNRTVILAVSSPRSDIFRFADQIMTLAFGEMIYFGNGLCSDLGLGVLDYFSGIGFPCPVGYNLSDHLADVVFGKDETMLRYDSIAESDSEDEHCDTTIPIRDCSRENIQRLEKRARMLSDCYYNSACGSQLAKQFIHPPKSINLAGTVSTEASPNPFQTLARRAATIMYRDPWRLGMHYGIAIMIVPCFGLVFCHFTDNMAGIQNRLGFMFLVLLFLGLNSLTINTTFDFGVFFKERSNKLYHPAMYLATQFLSDMVILRAVPALIFGALVYNVTGLAHDLISWFRFVTILVLFSLCCSSLCLLMSVIFGTTTAATIILASQIFGGLLVNTKCPVTPLSWIRHFSIFGHAYESLVVNELEHMWIDSEIPGMVLEQLGFRPSPFWENGLALLCTLAVTSCLLFLVLGRRVSKAK